MTAAKISDLKAKIAAKRAAGAKAPAASVSPSNPEGSSFGTGLALVAVVTGFFLLLMKARKSREGASA